MVLLFSKYVKQQIIKETEKSSFFRGLCAGDIDCCKILLQKRLYMHVPNLFEDIEHQHHLPNQTSIFDLDPSAIDMTSGRSQCAINMDAMNVLMLLRARNFSGVMWLSILHIDHLQTFNVTRFLLLEHQPGYLRCA